MLDKAPEAFRTISEVAEDLSVPQHVLRFWETRFAQIRPMKRGGGRRFYRPHDVDLLKGIRVLLYSEGYTIRGVQRILKEDGVAYVGAVGRGETAARKRSAEDLILDGVPQPGAAKPAPRVAKPIKETLVKPALMDEAPKILHQLSDTQIDSLKAALKELEDARSLLGSR